MSFNFSVPTNALFGAGKLGELHTQINTPMGAVHGRKALVVISNGKSTRTNGYLDRLENELKQSNVEYVIFDKVGSNPTKPVVEEGGRFAKENGCDFIVALGGGSVMDASKATCVSEHPLEHALSAYHEKLPHGAGLIMISKAFYSFFINKHVCDDRFIEMAKLMGMEDASKPEDFITMLVKLQEDCNVAELKMSDYRITPEEFPKMAENARATLGINFENDMYKLTNEDCVTIYQESYK